MQVKNIQMKLLISSLLGLSSLVMAQYDYPADPVLAGLATGESGQIYSSIVTKIDGKNRVVTFKNKDGELDIVAGPEVKNFAQIKVGDSLHIAYKLPVAIEFEKIKNNPINTKSNIAKLNIVKNSASIVSIDKGKQILTLKESQGNVLNLKIENPTLLKGISVNDRVNVIYAQPIAFKMSPIKK
jgi:hypothetical protein